ncbi:heavy-metal-associated domain-containing protein [Enterococcus saccharolyticus]|uniref:HMA domain-containing protein n=1 Tax=Candidatus Enterococcus willemsii TaxID=1857215 RepID=A0ABQ6YXI3_9ENTE|nr:MULTISPECIES: cation transporter [Enterococcus]KAF1302704.1 hypothetical protein BAU17_05295 [Enterococcus sp. CU12B]MCD5002362.1 heavy-metal-associated domain-containing protein [Enterococcus saccharolyticus]
MNTTYLVSDMSCGHCKAKIEKAVNALAGVQSATADVESKILSVTAKEDVKNEAIVAAVGEAGYTAERQ